MDIRENIKNNFKNTTIEEMKVSIDDSINEKDEITLPGLGVFFEMLWNNSNTEEQNQILDKIKQGL